MPLDLVQALSDLIAIPSVNPMGHPCSGEEFLETRVTAHLERVFRSLGILYQRQTVEPGRDNLVARIDGSPSVERGGQLILLEAHQDTVPATGMTIPPWTPEVRDGRIYGRGACDIKGGLAAMLAAVARVAEDGPCERPTIVFACTVNEEFGFSGAVALTKLWTTPGSIIPRKPDAAIIAEPTSLDVVVAHKGVVRWQCRTRGRAAHSSQPELGENAIYKMTHVVQALERYAAGLASHDAHPLCGRPTLSVGTIEGGISVNIVPDECRIHIDRRLLPGEDAMAAYRDAGEFLAKHAGGTEGKRIEAEHDPPFLIAGSLPDENNGALARSLIAAATEVVGRCQAIGVPFGTNASTISEAGVPSVVFGPGSIAQAHTADEWLPLDELHAASEILYHFATRGLI